VCHTYSYGTTLDLGRVFSFVGNNGSIDAPFSLSYSHGTTGQCTNSNGATTTINFICAPNSGASSPTFVQQSTDYCTYIFNWETYAACPVCTDSDYTTVVGTCSGGVRQVSKTRANNCNGPMQIIIPSQGCSATEFPSGAVAGVVVAFAAVTVTAGGVVWRNRVISRRYANLMDESRSAGHVQL